jgi:opacity protein-like surface antigen
VFKFVAAFMVICSGTASAAEVAQECLPTPASTQQVSAMGEYHGQGFAFTVTVDGHAVPGFDAPPKDKRAAAKDKPCPLTS